MAQAWMPAGMCALEEPREGLAYGVKGPGCRTRWRGGTSAQMFELTILLVKGVSF